MATLTLLLLLAVAGCVSSPPDIATEVEPIPSWTPTTRLGTPYEELRADLIAQGYEPVTLPTAEACSESSTCYPELFECAERNPCLYTWRRGETLFEIQTSSGFARVARLADGPRFDDEYGFRWGTEHPEARSASLAKGVQPVAIAYDAGGGCFGGCPYPETTACAGTGEAPCGFRWQISVGP